MADNPPPLRAGQKYHDAAHAPGEALPAGSDWSNASAENRINQLFKDLKIPSGVGDGKPNPIRVDTAALRTFAANLDPMIAELRKLQAEVQKVEIRPGAFPHGEDFKRRSAGGTAGGTANSSSAKQSTLEFTKNAINGLTECAEGLKKLAGEYDRTEDDSKLDAKKLGDYIKNARQYITSITGTGSAGGTG